MAGREPQRHPAQHVRAGLVAERDSLERDRERTGRQVGTRPVLDGRLEPAQLLEAVDARAGALQLLDLLGDLRHRHEEQAAVGAQHVDRAEAHLAASVQVGAEREDGAAADREGEHAGVDDQAVDECERAVAGQHAPVQLGQAAQHVGQPAFRPKVLGGGQPLLQEADDVGADPPDGAAVWLGEAASGRERGQRDRREEREEGADPPVLADEDDQDADQEQQTAGNAHDQLREEAGERGDVAVDALDQLSGGVAAVKGEVEPQAVERDVGLEPVRGRPPDVLGQVRRRHADGLADQADRQEGEGEAKQRLDRPERRRAVDEAPEQLGTGHLQADAREQQDRQEDRPRALGREVGGQQVAVGTQRHGHAALPVARLYGASGGNQDLEFRPGTRTMGVLTPARRL